MTQDAKELGLITSGSLVEGLQMKLGPERSVEEVKAGKFVVVHGLYNQFFSLITDVRLDASSPNILVNPPSRDEELLRSVLTGTSAYATIELRPMLMLGHDDRELRPVKTIPPHFASVSEATSADVSMVFGREDGKGRFFNVGSPLDMDIPVCINLDRFVERSNGIFGKSGTGKTFLTRVMLAGVIRYGKAVNLIFDMHNEYGWETESEDSKGFVKGLKQLFPERVAIFSLDPESTRKRGRKPDVEAFISLGDIDIEDVALLQDELQLNTTAIESAFAIYRRYGQKWLSELLSWEEDELAAISKELGTHVQSLSAMRRKLNRLKALPFIVEDSIQSEGTIKKMLDHLGRGISIVLEFGRSNSTLAYLLAANIISRRIHDNYIDRTEKYHATKDSSDKPRQLMITIEEAHKFLNSQAARQTIFGTIARELRKYSVTMLIVDQRPSGIDDEVISQVGTRITALLNDEKDIQSVLTGVSGTAGLRSVLASLDTKQQALILGHAVPMPVVVKTREYGESFYREISRVPEEGKGEELIGELYG
ncbi:MAG TPA: ATP-binding protein [Thermodesulfobacteriota bacterium]|nr:ATP-binding protein [Thermodesulfobacteriota bacterium]